MGLARRHQIGHFQAHRPDNGFRCTASVTMQQNTPSVALADAQARVAVIVRRASSGPASARFSRPRTSKTLDYFVNFGYVHGVLIFLGRVLFRRLTRPFLCASNLFPAVSARRANRNPSPQLLRAPQSAPTKLESRRYAPAGQHDAPMAFAHANHRGRAETIDGQGRGYSGCIGACGHGRASMRAARAAKARSTAGRVNRYFFPARKCGIRPASASARNQRSGNRSSRAISGSVNMCESVSMPRVWHRRVCAIGAFWVRFGNLFFNLQGVRRHVPLQSFAWPARRPGLIRRQ